MIVLLHNSFDQVSRSVAEQLAGLVCEIDWYKDHAVENHDCHCVNGEPYLGPDPSIFPVLVAYDDNPPPVPDEEGNLIPQLPGWKVVNRAQALTDLDDESKVYRQQ